MPRGRVGAADRAEIADRPGCGAGRTVDRVAGMGAVGIGGQRSPVKRPICTCLTGEKSEGLVLILIPGSSIGTVKSLRLAACFITFSRVSSSPHCFSTCTVFAAIDGP